MAALDLGSSGSDGVCLDGCNLAVGLSFNGLAVGAGSGSGDFRYSPLALSGSAGGYPFCSASSCGGGLAVAGVGGGSSAAAGSLVGSWGVFGASGGSGSGAGVLRGLLLAIGGVSAGLAGQLADCSVARSLAGRSDGASGLLWDSPLSVAYACGGLSSGSAAAGGGVSVAVALAGSSGGAGTCFSAAIYLPRLLVGSSGVEGWEHPQVSGVSAGLSVGAGDLRVSGVPNVALASP